MVALKLTVFGEAVGVVFAHEMLAKLKVANGDTLFAVETSNGYLLTTANAAADELALGREFVDDYWETFRALGK